MALPGIVDATMLEGQLIIGLSMRTVLSVAVLFVGLGSSRALTVAVLSTTELAVQLTETVRVMVSVEELGILPKTIRRLLPAPPQEPLPVAEQETKVVEAGKLSITLTGPEGKVLVLAALIE